MSFHPSVVLSDLTFSWPDGDIAVDGLNGAFGRGRTGLVGANGAGKSTLLRLISGELTPVRGSVTVTGSVDYLPQHLTLQADASLAQLLGVHEVVAAVRAVTAGDVSPALFDLIGSDGWDIEERAAAALAQAGLPPELDRRVGQLSGGEAMLAGVVGVRLRGASVALLDEPTNNLDGTARERLYELVRAWRGALIVVSHDTELLDLMDDTAELRGGGLTVFGGPFSAYRQRLEEEQAAARQALATAKQRLRVEKRQRSELQERLAHSERQGRKDRVNRKYPTIVLNGRRNAAERSEGMRRGVADDKIAQAQTAVDAADSLIRDDDRIVVDLPDPGVARGRRIALLRGADGREFVVQGPERVALTGDNGVGKTTLIERALAAHAQAGGPGDAPDRTVAAAPALELLTDRVAYLPQRIDTLDERATVLASVAAGAPDVPTPELRNRLARFLIRGRAVDRPVGSLSGGERFRVALARLLLAEPPAQLLILDEPTNNLDLDSIDRLVEALAAYRGALLVVSHDRGFLGRLGLDAELRLEASGAITQEAQ